MDLFVVLTLAISVGVQNRPANAPEQGPWDKEFHLFRSPTVAEAMSAIASVIFAYGATPI